MLPIAMEDEQRDNMFAIDRVNKVDVYTYHNQGYLQNTRNDFQIYSISSMM